MGKRRLRNSCLRNRGACASVSAAVKCGYRCKDAEINVLLRGGKLYVRYTDEAVFMTGHAGTVFTGKTEI